MENQIVQVIDALSGKLGVAAEHLYPLMIRQSYISGIKAIVWVLISIVVMIAYAKLILYYFAPYKDNITRYRECSRNDTEILPFTLTLVGSYVACGAVAIFCVCINTAVNALSNPEWYAIKELLSQIK